jgi:hypothetical protein
MLLLQGTLQHTLHHTPSQPRAQGLQFPELPAGGIKPHKNPFPLGLVLLVSPSLLQKQSLLRCLATYKSHESMKTHCLAGGVPQQVKLLNLWLNQITSGFCVEALNIPGRTGQMCGQPTWVRVPAARGSSLCVRPREKEDGMGRLSVLPRRQGNFSTSTPLPSLHTDITGQQVQGPLP